jgi:hypothetical protein
MAKLYGCYEALVSGRTIEGLSTLTGSPIQCIQLHPNTNLKNNEKIDVDLVWTKLLSSRFEFSTFSLSIIVLNKSNFRAHMSLCIYVCPSMHSNCVI